MTSPVVLQYLDPGLYPVHADLVKQERVAKLLIGQLTGEAGFPSAISSWTKWLFSGAKYLDFLQLSLPARRQCST